MALHNKSYQAILLVCWAVSFCLLSKQNKMHKNASSNWTEEVVLSELREVQANSVEKQYAMSDNNKILFY